MIAAAPRHQMTKTNKQKKQKQRKNSKTQTHNVMGHKALLQQMSRRNTIFVITADISCRTLKVGTFFTISISPQAAKSLHFSSVAVTALSKC